jgi:hypothetical protein
MKILELANLYNNYLPSTEQLKMRSLTFNSAVDDLDVIATLNLLTFKYNIELESAFLGEKLFQLIEKTNISQIDPGNIVFYNKIDKSDHVIDGLEFARQNDYYKICLNVHDSTIVWYDDESDDVEIVARDLDQFLLFVLECHKDKMNKLYNVEYSKVESKQQVQLLISQGLSKLLVRDHMLFE